MRVMDAPRMVSVKRWTDGRTPARRAPGARPGPLTTCCCNFIFVLAARPLGNRALGNHERN